MSNKQYLYYPIAVRLKDSPFRVLYCNRTTMLQNKKTLQQMQQGPPPEYKNDILPRPIRQLHN